MGLACPDQTEDSHPPEANNNLPRGHHTVAAILTSSRSKATAPATTTPEHSKAGLRADKVDSTAAAAAAAATLSSLARLA